MRLEYSISLGKALYNSIAWNLYFSWPMFLIFKCLIPVVWVCYVDKLSLTALVVSRKN